MARQLGVRAVQGHHVSPPLPREDLRAFLLGTGGDPCPRCFPAVDDEAADTAEAAEATG